MRLGARYEEGKKSQEELQITSSMFQNIGPSIVLQWYFRQMDLENGY